jgi:hypothetical protein
VGDGEEGEDRGEGGEEGVGAVAVFHGKLKEGVEVKRAEAEDGVVFLQEGREGTERVGI